MTAVLKRPTKSEAVVFCLVGRLADWLYLIVAIAAVTVPGKWKLNKRYLVKT